MAAEAGIGGLVKIGANTVANLNKWTLTPKINIVKVTPFQAAGSWEVKLGTVKDWTAKADGFLDPADTNGQVTLFNGLGSTVTLELDVDGTHHWSGSAILSQFDPMSDVAGVNTISFTFEGSGAITFT